MLVLIKFVDHCFYFARWGIQNSSTDNYSILLENLVRWQSVHSELCNNTQLSCKTATNDKKHAIHFCESCMFVLVMSQLWALFLFLSSHGEIQYWPTCFLLKIWVTHIFSKKMHNPTLQNIQCRFCKLFPMNE